MLGYCMSCHQLRPIRGRREFGATNYYPFPHNTPVRHAGCGGVVYDMDDEVGTCACEFCEQVVPVEQRVPSAECDGHKRAIK